MTGKIAGVRFVLLLLLVSCTSARAPLRLWDDAALAGWATPVAGLGVPPSYPTAAEYYAAPIDSLRTYPVYYPSSEPPGYRDMLRARDPQPITDLDALGTDADWIRAGRQVFEELDTADARTSDPDVLAHFTSAAAIDQYRDQAHDVVDANGVLLDYR